MAVNIVTGMTGTEHITADDARSINALIFGTGKYVFPCWSQFEATIVSNNQVRISDGMCINQGTQMGIEPDDYVDCVISNGASGYCRNDLIVMRYSRNSDSGIESAELVVIEGDPGTTATDPEYTSGDILECTELVDDYPLYRVVIESLSITAVEPLFTVLDSLASSMMSTSYDDSSELLTLAFGVGSSLGSTSSGSTSSSDGTSSSTTSTYTLPVATTSTLGGVIIGDGLTVDDTGMISVDLTTISDDSEAATAVVEAGTEELTDDELTEVYA